MKPNNNEAKYVFIIALIFLAPLQFYVFRNNDTLRKLMIPFCVYFISSIFLFKNNKKSKIFIVGLLLATFIIISQLSYRFILIQYILPIAIIIILKDILVNKRIKISLKGKMFLFFGVLLVSFYGIISEIKKLGLPYNSITSVFTNVSVLFYWINRQVYRIFGIWVNLGGNIIEYVQQNNFFYGITYIKFFAKFFGFEYISLPTISAQLVGANYAQPGLVAEGYANFGIPGAVMNVFIVLLISEVLWHRFVTNQTMFNLLLVVIPFTSIILDGGTVNSIIFNIIIINISFIYNTITIYIKLITKQISNRCCSDEEVNSINSNSNLLN